MTNQEKEEARSEMTCAQMESYFKEALNSGWDPLEVDDFKRNILQELFSEHENEFGDYTPQEKANACKLMMEHGVHPDSNVIGSSWPTPLCMAIQEGNFECVKIFLEHGADPNRYDPNPLFKLTPLLGAVAKKDEALCRLLLEHGADPMHAHTVDLYGSTPDSSLRESLGYQGDDTSNALRDLVVREATPLFCAAATGNAPACKLLLEHGADLASRVEVEIKQFHSSGAEVDSSEDGPWARWQETPMQAAERSGHPEAAAVIRAHLKKKELEKKLQQGPRFSASDLADLKNSPRPLRSTPSLESKGRSRL